VTEIISIMVQLMRRQIVIELVLQVALNKMDRLNY